MNVTTDRCSVSNSGPGIKLLAAMCLAAVLMSPTAHAQSVCLPAPRLLTTMPMGGKVGTSLEVTITGENFEEVGELSFSNAGITATSKLDSNGVPIANKYVVVIADDCPVGIHEARVMTRLGVSSSRVFNVGSLPETIRTQANRSLETAMPLILNSTCNVVMTAKAVDFYTFEATKGQRVVADCAAKGIDSKLNAVLIIADSQGQDLLAERRGGELDFTAPESGQYVIKVHDLTFNGGAPYFYRLTLQTAAQDETINRLPQSRPSVPSRGHRQS